MPKPAFYITTPIYYVNDQPHIGHAYTTIAADALARWHRQKGDDVFFLTGTDEHGAKVAESAHKAGKEPKAFTDENSRKFQEVFERLAITNDRFLRTTDDDHVRRVQLFMAKLKKSGAIRRGVYEGLYCTGCENFLTEKELVDGKCPVHKRSPERIKEENYFFKLTDYLPEVRTLIETHAIRIEPESRRREALGLLDQGLEDFSISREKVAWGIPFLDDPKQTIYVWVEALQNYITAIGYGEDAQQFKRYWPSVTHLMAKDILKFHTIYWPALLLAAGEEPPKRIFLHGFFTVNGEKMSKSLGNVIDPKTLADQFGSDGTRWLLLGQFPFGDDGDIRADQFATQYNADLANGIGNLASRILTMIQKFTGGEVPSGDGVSAATQSLTRKAITAVDEAFAAFAFHRALREIRSLVAEGDGIVDREKPWELAKNDPARLAHVLTDLLAILGAVAVCIRPLLPNASRELDQALGLRDMATIEPPCFPPGRSLGPLKPLFPRVAPRS
jgi:methionyl-tRNA synthetase